MAGRDLGFYLCADGQHIVFPHPQLTTRSGLAWEAFWCHSGVSTTCRVNRWSIEENGDRGDAEPTFRDEDILAVEPSGTIPRKRNQYTKRQYGDGTRA